jgi:hypothetical protein
VYSCCRHCSRGTTIATIAYCHDGVAAGLPTWALELSDADTAETEALQKGEPAAGMVVDPPSYAASSALVPALPASGVEESKGDDSLGIINPAAFDARGSDALLLRFLLSRIRELPLVADCVNTVTGGSWMWCHYPLVCAIYGMAHPHKYTWRRIFGVKLWDTVVDAYEWTYPRSSRPAIAWDSATLPDDLCHLLQAP